MLDVITTPGSESRYVRTGDDAYLEAWGGVEATCGTSWVRADSATYYERSGILYLYGNMEYRDEERTLVADRATYYKEDEWVKAEGNAVLTELDNGSTLSGPILNYYPLTDRRTIEYIFAPERPHLTVYPDTTPGALPFEVDADQLHLYGDSVIAGAGDVVAIRDQLTATGDSMHLDLAGDRLWLFGEPGMEAKDVTLEGDTILALLEEGGIREIVAWYNGAAASDELSIEAPTLRMFVADGEIERLVAWPGADEPERPDSLRDATWARGETADYILFGDSIEVQRPGGVLEQLVTVGRARAESTRPADPMDPTFGTDWMDGDTIFGFFEAVDSLAHEQTSDSASATGESELRRLVATGGARALYHVQDESAAAGEGLPGVNYVLGNVVIIWLQDSKVEEVRVIGPSTGVYLEPIPPATNGDSTVAPAASAADSVRAGAVEPRGRRR